MNQGKYRRAEELLGKSLKIREKIPGEPHPDTPISYNNLAGVFAPGGQQEGVIIFL